MSPGEADRQQIIPVQMDGRIKSAFTLDMRAVGGNSGLRIYLQHFKIGLDVFIHFVGFRDDYIKTGASGAVGLVTGEAFLAIYPEVSRNRVVIAGFDRFNTT